MKTTDYELNGSKHFPDFIYIAEYVASTGTVKEREGVHYHTMK
jgi:hypothetical protein